MSFQNIDPWCVLVQEWEFWSFSRASLMKTGFEGRLISRVSGLVLVDDVLLQTGSLPCVGLFGKVQVRISLQSSIAATFFTHSCLEGGGVPGGKVSGVLWGKTQSAVTKQLHSGFPYSLCTYGLNLIYEWNVFLCRTSEGQCDLLLVSLHRGRLKETLFFPFRVTWCQSFCSKLLSWEVKSGKEISQMS